jgi:hypothetical protein
MLTPEEQQMYAVRAAALLKLGYSSYKTYLASAIWKDIRSRVLLEHMRCRACGRKATQVHHNRYHLDDLNGKCLDHLIPVCGTCHKTAEFNKRGSKLGPQRATAKLDDLRVKNQKIWRKQDAATAWRNLFSVLDDMRIYLGMDESEEARALVERHDAARAALPPKRESKQKRRGKKR